MLTERQEKLLDFLIREYVSTAEPVSSFALKKCAKLDVSPATVRNDLQDLAKAGYIKQPHTSAGRVPTQKAYKYFADKVSADAELEFENFIVRQIEFAHKEMEREMEIMQNLMDTLEQDDIFSILNILESWHKKMSN